MSSVEKKSPNEKYDGDEEQQQAPADALKSPPQRPTLVGPPARPVRPAPAPAQAPAQAKVAKPVADPLAVPSSAPTELPAAAADPDPATHRYLPIAPPSEPMQYRAIGLVRGTYAPTEADQLNRGNLTTDDGQVIDSVLLGRVTSLVKKHLDLGSSHLWVVYPRTRREADVNEEQDLHLQIVGVWEPETLGLPGESPAAPDSETTADSTDDSPSEDHSSEDSPDSSSEASPSDATSAAPKTDSLPPDLPPVDENFFSIRGEVVKHEPDNRQVMVKILQGVKRTPGAPKSFKLMLQGDIEGRTLGYFWDFQVKRTAKTLVIESAAMVGIVPPKKRTKGGGGARRGPGGRRPGPGRPGTPPRQTAGVQGRPIPKKSSPKPDAEG